MVVFELAALVSLAALVVVAVMLVLAAVVLVVLSVVLGVVVVALLEVVLGSVVLLLVLLLSVVVLAVVLVAVVLAMVGGWLVLRRYRMTGYTRAASALVLGGFFGNLLDRAMLGYVLDMVYFPWLPWFVCNLADIAICTGVALLCASLLWRPDDWRLKTEAGTDGAHHLHGNG